MLFLKLWNYIRGYVIIVVKGYFLEKFLNICTHRQIFLWDIKRQKDGIMILKVSIRGFRLLRPVARKSGCRVRIYRKKGIPFILNRYRKRKAFVLGAVVFVLLIYVMSSFIWNVELSGNKKLDSALIMDKLASYGIRQGVLKFKIDVNRVANRLVMDIRELAWAGVEVRGTKVKVSVVERVMPPDLIPTDIPCNITAQRDGIIKSIVAKAGQETVTPGDTVVKGQILISGEVKSKDDVVRLVHAIGTVKARTWYEGSRVVSLKVQEKKRTGRTKGYFSIMLFTKRIDFFAGKTGFTDFEKVETTRKLAIGENLVFPFEFITGEYYECATTEKELNLDEAKKIAADNAYREANEEIPENAEIVNSYINFVNDAGGGMRANAVIECIEDIGITEEIGG